MKVDNAAVFVGGQRKFKNVNVEYTDNEVIITNRVSKAEMGRYSVVEVAKAPTDVDETLALDISDGGQEASVLPLVVQQGCGCSGMRPYDTDESYTGPFVKSLRRR